MLAARFCNLAHRGACFLHHLFYLILLLLLVECWLAQDYLESTTPWNLGVAVWYLMIHVYNYIIVITQDRAEGSGWSSDVPHQQLDNNPESCCAS